MILLHVETDVTLTADDTCKEATVLHSGQELVRTGRSLSMARSQAT